MSGRDHVIYHGDVIAPAWAGGFIVRGFHNPVQTFATEDDARRWIDAQNAEADNA